MTNDASGVALISRILPHLAQYPATTVSSLAVAVDASRSTVFALIGKMEAAGLTERDASGRVWLGVEASRLGFAAFGLGRILSRAEALIPILRDDTDASASLLVRRGDQARVLIHRRAAWDTLRDGDLPTLEAAVVDSNGAYVRLQLRPQAGKPEQALAAASLARVADALSQIPVFSPMDASR